MLIRFALHTLTSALVIFVVFGLLPQLQSNRYVHPTEAQTSVDPAPTDSPTLSAPAFVVTPTPTPRILGTVTVIGPPLEQEPVNREGTVMIPKIGVNSPIEFDVSVSDRNEYQAALENGVAHAAGTSKPTNTVSNTYLFAHSTADEANIAHYAAVFTKLKQLDEKDQVIVFYQSQRYDYEVVKEEVVPSFDTTVLTREYDFAALTLQTCDPPGVPQDRFITTARLVGVYDR